MSARFIERMLMLIPYAPEIAYLPNTWVIVFFPVPHGTRPSLHINWACFDSSHKPITLLAGGGGAVSGFFLPEMELTVFLKKAW